MEQKHIFLIGFMGSGKTSVAKCLSSMLGLELAEMDQTIEKQQDMSISDIFSTYGEEHFRNLETKLLIELQEKEPMVISCGGGTPMREENIKEMKKSGKTILLTASPETIYMRVKDSHDRPLLEQNKTIPYIKELMDKRQPKYEQAADHIIETDQKNIEEICEEIKRKINQ